MIGSFKNNHRRNRYKSNNERNFRKRNGNGHKVNVDFNSQTDFKRKNPGRNNQNAAKLIEKYNDLAREALSNGDKILSENYLQHSDHFYRILSSQDLVKQILTHTNSIQEEKKTNLETTEQKKDT